MSGEIVALQAVEIGAAERTEEQGARSFRNLTRLGFTTAYRRPPAAPRVFPIAPTGVILVPSGP